MSEAVVIVGSGLAGYNVARELRKLDANVPLVVISRDHAGFYSKPMLSNALAGKKTAASLVTKSAEKMADEVKLRVLARTSVTKVDTTARTLTLSSGEVLPDRDLVLALGADPIRLHLEGDAADAVLSVNDLDDFARFAAALDTAGPGGQPVKRVAILGAGLIGCEFANDLSLGGYQVELVAPCEQVMPGLLHPAAAVAVQAGLESLGARFHLGPVLASLNHKGAALEAHLSDGSVLACDLVLSAVGLRPRTELAAAAGLEPVERREREGRHRQARRQQQIVALVEGRHLAAERVARHGTGGRLPDIVEVAPQMRPARSLPNTHRTVRARLVQGPEAGIGVGLKDAVEVHKMVAGMFALAVARIVEQRCRRGLAGKRPVIAHIHPQPASARLAASTPEHTDRRVVAMNLGSVQNVPA